MSPRPISLGIFLVLLQFSGIFVVSSKVALTRNELKSRYGQGITELNSFFQKNFPCTIHFLTQSILENTTFDDGKSCDRICDGKRMTCYYEFNVENVRIM